MATERRMQVSVVAASTLAFTVCFAVWTMFAVIGIPIKQTLGLNETQFGLLAATPVLTGSLIRVPLGMLTDRYGGRIVFFVLMLSIVAPIWLLAYATEFWHYLVLGLFVGCAGGSFSVGIAYVARWFERDRQGLAMGIFGAGNTGAAVTMFVAPTLMVAFGWAMVPKVYAAAVLATALLFWAFSYTDREHHVSASVTVKDQLAMLRDPNVWRYCQYYSITFGGFVALSLWMTKYYITEYGFDIRVAALLVACFSLPGGVLRAVGGWLTDRFGAHPVTWWVMLISWVCLFFLSYPQTDLVVKTTHGSVAIHVGLNAWVFTALMFVMGVTWSVGNASVFKYISDEYSDNIGAISGIVGLVGALGGFLLPIMFGALVDITGINSSVFMLLWGITLVSLVWMYWTEIVPRRNGRVGSAPAMASRRG